MLFQAAQHAYAAKVQLLKESQVQHPAITLCDCRINVGGRGGNFGMTDDDVDNQGMSKPAER